MIVLQILAFILLLPFTALFLLLFSFFVASWKLLFHAVLFITLFAACFGLVFISFSAFGFLLCVLLAIYIGRMMFLRNRTI